MRVKKLKQSRAKIAKRLRKTSTDAEALLWSYLRNKQLDGLKFRRQQPIGKYVVDFVCQEKKIVIELDGGLHSKAKPRDKQRDDWLRKEGYKVLRIWNKELFEDLEAALEFISANCSPSP